MDKRPAALAILGPTASGKTALALRLAEQLPVEIISLDSALVYRGMDIGTAKPSAAERAAVPHHLIDIIDPPDSYSAADFVADCSRLAGEIQARGRLPLIVGGTLMYYHALTQGLNQLPAADEAVRAALQAEKAEQGLTALYRRLCAVDPITAARLEPADSQRIERALEVFLLTGKPLSAHFAEQQSQPAALDLFTLTLEPGERHLLHEHIARRFHHMLAEGLLDEVRSLQTAYPELTAEHPAMRCVGYRQAWDYLAGAIDAPQLAEQGIAATRQLAKRQLTWLRKLGSDCRLDPYRDAEQLLPRALQAVRQHFPG